MPHIHVEIRMGIMSFQMTCLMLDWCTCHLLELITFQSLERVVIVAYSSFSNFKGIIKIVSNFGMHVKKQWQILNERFHIHTWKRPFISTNFASIFSTIEENKTHNPWVGFGLSILVMYFYISGFEDKLGCHCCV